MRRKSLPIVVALVLVALVTSVAAAMPAAKVEGAKGEFSMLYNLYYLNFYGMPVYTFPGYTLSFDYGASGAWGFGGKYDMINLDYIDAGSLYLTNLYLKYQFVEGNIGTPHLAGILGYKTIKLSESPEVFGYFKGGVIMSFEMSPQMIGSALVTLASLNDHTFSEYEAGAKFKVSPNLALEINYAKELVFPELLPEEGFDNLLRIGMSYTF